MQLLEILFVIQQFDVLIEVLKLSFQHYISILDVDKHIFVGPAYSVSIAFDIEIDILSSKLTHLQDYLQFV